MNEINTNYLAWNPGTATGGIKIETHLQREERIASDNNVP
jgi:hypothetical protein